MASISIVIPALDEAATIGDTLESVHAQLREGDEVWVADAGSRDATCEIASRRARVLRSTGPRGRQLNDGAAAARGEILLFLHADCRLGPGGLEEVRASLSDRSVSGGCFPIVFPARDVARMPLLAWVQAGINLRTRVLRQGTGDQGLFARGTTFREVGGFQDWPLMEDLDLCRRLKCRGRFQILHVPLETSARRWLQGGLIRTQLKMWGFRAAFALGIPPEALARRYASIR